MSFTRFHDDPCRVRKELQESTGPGKYMLNVPGNGAYPSYIVDPQVRLQAVIALGKIDDPNSTLALERMLADIEPNVRWDAAIALAKQKNSSGRRIILDLLDRKYLDSFSNIDKIEQVQAMMVAINVASLIQDSDLKQSLLELNKLLKSR